MPPEIHLADYRAPAWRVRQVRLRIELDAGRSEVESELELEPDPAQPGAPLRLDGEELELLDIALDGIALDPARYRFADGVLEVDGVAAPCRLKTRVAVRPASNTRLEGLYRSGDILLTQCEAEGFRRISFFPDRPDVLARFEVTLVADAARFPVLLANGDRVAARALPGGRHEATWVDPHPKPCYLFALVAGPLEAIEQRFVTAGNREVAVRVWAAPADLPRCRFALASAIAAMRWDEQRFGRCYDLGEFNIVAVQDFTMGAMENKGLNIFNARYILADPDSATDADYEAIESVIGHEYFHNWSGNRVTLRDWFQLSLKEGLTVLRDQEFTGDRRSRAIKRIDDVRLLRRRQFVEDAGPLAHPVRPDRYAEINNFYTVTVYEKGAELLRMLMVLLGEAAFRRGLDLYFARHDGEAVTIEDLLAALGEAADRDLSHYLAWWTRAGTPVLAIDEHWDPDAGRLEVSIRQRTPPTRGQAHEQALPLPLRYALYDAGGRALERAPLGADRVGPGLLELRRARTRLVFEGLAERPLTVWLQELSAPVRVERALSAAELSRLVAVEPDPLSRWDAVQQLALRALVGGDDEARVALVDATGVLLESAAHDPAFVAECLRLPEFDVLADHAGSIDVDGLVAARESLMDELAENHADRLEACYLALEAAAAGPAGDAAASAARRLRNAAMALLARLDPAAGPALAHLAAAHTQTDRLAALRVLVHLDAPAAPGAVEAALMRAGDDPQRIDAVLSILATRPHPDALAEVRGLIDSPRWQPANPNRVRAVLGAFARDNPLALHRRDGAGVALLFDQVRAIDAINPQVAARLLTALESWQRLDAGRRQRIGEGLAALDDGARSRDVADVLSRLRA